MYGHNVSDEEPEEYDVQSSISRLSITDRRKTRSTPSKLAQLLAPKVDTLHIVLYSFCLCSLNRRKLFLGAETCLMSYQKDSSI